MGAESGAGVFRWRDVPRVQPIGQRGAGFFGYRDGEGVCRTSGEGRNQGSAESFRLGVDAEPLSHGSSGRGGDDRSADQESLQQRITRQFNIRQGVFGPLWQGRYKAKVVKNQRYLDQLLSYIHLNPVVGGLVDDPGGDRRRSLSSPCEGHCRRTQETSGDSIDVGDARPSASPREQRGQKENQRPRPCPDRVVVVRTLQFCARHLSGTFPF